MLETGITFRHDVIILDACCLINLCATQRMLEILQTLAMSAQVASYVHQVEAGRHDVSPCVEANLLAVVDLDGDDEEERFVNYAAVVGDGEAYTGAIGVNRGWVIATDDRRATKLLRADAPHIQVVTTPELLKCWADRHMPEPDELRDTLLLIESVGRFVPCDESALFTWWRSAATYSQ